MKKIGFLLLFFHLINCNLGNSQIEDVYNKQIAFNGRAILSGLLDFTASPYQIALKSYGEKNNKRLFFGLNFNSTYNTGTESFNGLTSIALRAGKERFEDFGVRNKWRILYGIDGLLNISINQQPSNFRFQIGGGFSPFVGIQYRINKRLSNFIETSYQVIFNATSISDNLVLSLNGSLNQPTSIWIAVDLYKMKK